jgi:molybdate transport system substrate-binding protein
MQSKKLKTAAAAGISAALSVIAAPAAHAATNLFTIGVAANFSNVVQAIIGDFLSDNSASLPADAAIAFKIDSTGNIKNCILTSTSCTLGAQYDLFLSADKTTPVGLACAPTTTTCTINRAMIPPGTTVPTTPFFYADGSIVFWSKTSTVATLGLPSTFTSALVIGDPSKAPYGFAGMTILRGSPWNLTSLASTLTYPPTTFGGLYTLINTQPNILQTYQRVVAGTTQSGYLWGFVAKSFVCTEAPGSTVQQITNYGTEYLYSDTQHGYPPIIQYGLAVEQSQSSTVKNNVLNFVAYLQAATAQQEMSAACYGFSLE